MIDEKLLTKDIHAYFHAMIDRMHGTEIDKDVLTLNKDICGIINKQPKADWIPCEERLPEESNYYMACIYNSDVDDFDFRKTWFAHVDDYDIEESEWRELYDFETVTAWQPLPQPYKKEGNSNENT